MSSSASAEACFEAVGTQLRTFETLVDRVPKLLPDFISQAFDYDSSIPIAAVCLSDCVDTLGAARYAVDRYCEVGAEQRQEGSEAGAVFFERYYLDDLALRLYSAAEHLANAIITMMETTDTDLAEIRGTSHWERVRKFLNRHHPMAPITIAVNSLRHSKAWRFTMRYRGRWVHNQPPTVAGLGLVYTRRKRWETSEDGKHRRLAVGGGDQPEHTAGDLAQLFLAGFAAFLDVAVVVVNSYFRLLEEGGIRETEKGLGTITRSQPA